MPKSDKAKTAGKFAVVMLSLAILFFLLLPFLDNSEAAGGSGKKAVPQIFTSNPLSDLVRKIYSMFAKNQRAPGARGGQAFALAQGGPAYQATPGAGNNERYAAENDGKSGSSSVGASYDYGDAGIINEDGEWVLVRQTAPDAAQRGMHEINSSDTAYEKLMRLERAAKYTGRPGSGGPVIPDSKWARLWKPIKNFFTGESDAPEAADVQQAFALASASGGLGQDADKRGNTYGRAAEPDIKNAGFTGSAGGNFKLPQVQSLEKLLNTEISLDEIKDNIISLAEKDLSKTEVKNLKQLLDEKGRELVTEAKARFQNKILAEAQDKPVENLIEKTFSDCAAGSSTLYSSSSEKHTACSAPPAPEEVQKQQEESFKRIEQYAQVSLQNKPRLLVVLGKAKDINPPELSQPEQKLAKEFYDYMLEQKGCNKNDCIWVANEVQPGNPRLRNSVEAAGMDFVGAPTKSFNKLMGDFLNKAAQDKSVSSDDLINFQSDPGSLSIGYLPVTKEEWQELTQKNTPANIAKNPQDAFFVFGESAQLATLMKDGLLPNPGMTLRDPDGVILDSTATQDDLTDRAPLIQKSLFNQIDEYKQIAKDAGRELEQLGLSELAKQRAQKIIEEFKHNSGQSLDEQMGLSGNK